MAHKIDNSKGFNAYVGAGVPAWHGLGTTLNRTITAADCLNLGGLDFVVDKLPNIHKISNEIQIPSETSFFTYRKDVNKVLGSSVGKVYTVVQNTDALGIIDDIMKNDSNIIVETAGCLDEGRISFVTLKMQNPKKVGKNDEYYQYILVVNSFDGKTPILCLYTNIRVVCFNTFSAAIASKNKAFTYTIRHTGTAENRMKEALNVLAQQKKIEKLTHEAFEKMYGTKLTGQQMKDFAYNILLNDTEITAIQQGKPITDDKDKAVSTRKLNMIDGILEFTEIGIGQDMARGTAWNAFQGVTGFFSNVRPYADEKDKFINLVMPTGTANEYNTKAFELALNPTKIRPIKPLNLSNQTFNFN